MIEKGDFDIDRIVTPKETQAETTDDFEVSLRPKTLDEYIGQEKVKENLKIYIQAAKTGATALTMFCFTARLVWARPHFLP